MFTLLLLFYTFWSSKACDVTLCTHGSADFRKCQDLAHEFISVGYLSIKCIEESDSHGCLDVLRSSDRTIMTMNAGNLFHTSMKWADIKTVLAEWDGVSEMWLNFVKDYSVALVKAGNSYLRFEHLGNKRICHGVFDIDSSSGWDIPISLLSFQGRFSKRNRCSIVKTVNDYFGPSCLPGPSGVLALGDYMRTCQVCSSGSCMRETIYRGEDGQLKCLIEDAGEVAFVTHDAIFKYIDDVGGEEAISKEDFRLLCPDGRQALVDDYKSCYSGIMMSNVVVASGNMSDELVTKVQQQLRNPPPLAQKFIFNNIPYSISSNTVLFSNTTKELVPLKGSLQNPRNYLDQYSSNVNPSYLQTMDSLYCNAAATVICSGALWHLVTHFSFILFYSF